MNSRQKGARGERFVAKWLRETFGLDARRGVQYQGSPDSPDVVNGFSGCHPEVKFVEKLNIQNAMDQCVNDAGERLPYVIHKRNRGDLLVTIRAGDLIEFSKIVVQTDTINNRENMNGKD